MDLNYNPLNIITLFGALQGLALCVSIYYKRQIYKASVSMFILFLVSLAYLNLAYALLALNVFQYYRPLHLFPFPCKWLIGPSYYFYIKNQFVARNEKPFYRKECGYNKRDEQMAKNIAWLKNDLYPNEVIIVWAHTEHTMYKRNEAKFNIGKELPFYTRFTYGYNWKNMGDRVKNIFGSRVYSIGFSPINGIVDHSTNPAQKYSIDILQEPGSIEEKLIQLPYKFPFIDFSNLKTLPKSIFNESTISNSVLGLKLLVTLVNFLMAFYYSKC